jgi:hypothetical protein
MNGLLQQGLWAAETNRWDNMSNGFRSGFEGRRIEATDLVMGLLIMVAVVAVACVLAYLLRLRDKRRARTSPFRLFLSLCRAHELHWRESWWLWRLARSQRLSSPACLFLQPEHFDAVGLYPPLQRKAQLLTRLRDRLFAEPAQPGKNIDELQDVPHEARPDRRAEPQSDPLLLPDTASPALDIPPWRSSGAETRAGGQR